MHYNAKITIFAECFEKYQKMKRINLLLALAVIALGFTSCRDSSTDYMMFVGTWGLDHLQYYNVDYAGNPITGTETDYDFTPGDPDGGIDLVFRNDKTGEMRDRSRDIIYIKDSSTGEVIDSIICPDTTLVTCFTYNYHKGEPLYMNMESAIIFKMQIEELGSDNFTYINQYNSQIAEKAWMVRINDDANKERTSFTKPVNRVSRPGSLMSNY